jgi:hypothetical protein
MRDQVYDYLKTQSLGTMNLSSELPFDSSGQPLYVKNSKRVYVDIAESETDPFITALNGLNISFETTTVSVYFSVDAKRLPANYNSIVNQVKDSVNVNVQGFSQRTTQVLREYEDDLLITQIDLRFIKLT